MSKVCPLVFRQIDATISKISTTLVLSSLCIYFLTMHVGILFFISIDFVIRLSGKKIFSPIYLCANLIQKLFHLPVKMEDAGGKRLAAFFGLAFTIGMIITDYEGWMVANILIAIIFALCAIPDILFGYCIACKFYTLAKRIYPKGFA